MLNIYCRKCGAENVRGPAKCSACGASLSGASTQPPPPKPTPTPVPVDPVTGLKRCPFCAEEIQPAAIVCKHCGRDLGQVPISAAKKPAAPKQKNALPLLALFGFGALVLFAIYSYSSSSYSVDLEAARSAVSLMEKDGAIKSRSCQPNRTVMPMSYWISAPNDRTRKNLMNALSRLCVEEGAGPEMTIIDPSGLVIAQFDGRNIIR